MLTYITFKDIFSSVVLDPREYFTAYSMLGPGNMEEIQSYLKKYIISWKYDLFEVVKYNIFLFYYLRWTWFKTL